jgi:hypothetical protein
MIRDRPRNPKHEGVLIHRLNPNVIDIGVPGFPPVERPKPIRLRKRFPMRRTIQNVRKSS